MKQPFNPATHFAMLLMALAMAFTQANASEQSFTDSRDGKKYRIVKIGEQTWMAENLNYHDNSYGSCYEGNPENCKKYGRLYTFEAAMKACPSGWHLPSKEEWEVLSNYVGGSETEGKHLKATKGWGSNGNGEDTYGFSALPGGGGSVGGYFHGIDEVGGWWSSSKSSGGNAYSKLMYDNATRWDFSNETSYFSVRCIQDGTASKAVAEANLSAGKKAIYNGSIKLLNEAIPETDLAALDKGELRLLRNAIFAKHGLIFQSDDLKKHFSQFDWYKPMSRNVDNKLTIIDKENIKRIQAFEKAK